MSESSEAGCASSTSESVPPAAGGTPPSPPSPAPLSTEDVPAWVAAAPLDDLAPALEALCFALNRPVTVVEAAATLGRSPRDITDLVDRVTAGLRGHGIMLQRHESEIQLVTRPDVAWAVQRGLHPEKPARLSRPALEALAIVAYRQPVTRAGIEAIRGVNCDAVVESLERRGLIAEVGRQETPGRPLLFGTTLRFLQTLGLERIDDLPALPEGAVTPLMGLEPDESGLEERAEGGAVETASVLRVVAVAPTPGGLVADRGDEGMLGPLHQPGTAGGDPGAS